MGVLRGVLELCRLEQLSSMLSGGTYWWLWSWWWQRKRAHVHYVHDDAHVHDDVRNWRTWKRDAPSASWER